MDQERIKEAAKAAVEATGASSLPTWAKHLIWALIGAVAAVASMLCAGCTVSVDPGALQYIISNPIDRSGK